MFASITQVQSHYSSYSFWTRLKWLKKLSFCFCLENFKRKSRRKNLKSLVFTSFWFPHYCNHPFCGRRFCKTSICNSCCRTRWFTCNNPMKLSAFTYSPFCHVRQIISGFTISFGSFLLFMIPIKREMHWSPAVFTVLMNWLLGRSCVWRLTSISLVRKSK